MLFIYVFYMLITLKIFTEQVEQIWNSALSISVCRLFLKGLGTNFSEKATAKSTIYLFYFIIFFTKNIYWIIG